MTSPAGLQEHVTVPAWLDAIDRVGWAEVVDGHLVTQEAGEGVPSDNRHDIVARRLANALETAWGVPASAPARWELRREGEQLIVGRFPDALVADESLLRVGPFRGAPLAVVEVWSPANTWGEMQAKRVDYHDGGAQALVEAAINDEGVVSLWWFLRVERPDRWQPHAVAVGANPLSVTLPRPFEIVPNELLAFPPR